MENMTNYIKRKFGVDIDTFLHVLMMSPGAEGYIHGSLSELLFKEYAENLGYEVHRIKEKPGGGYNAKSDEARGDFYIRKKGNKKDEWYIIENKGIKTNTEKHLFDVTTKSKLFKHLKSLAFPSDDYLTKVYDKGHKSYLSKKEVWELQNKGKEFPKFNWNKKTPGARAFNLKGIWKNVEELEEWVEQQDEALMTVESYFNLEGPIRMLATHAPSVRVAPYTKIKQAAPLVSEFNIMCVDLFQRIGEHKFVFMNPIHISHSPTSPEHLYQNYHIDYWIKDVKENLNICPPWYETIKECIEKTKPKPRKLDKSQMDER